MLAGVVAFVAERRLVARVARARCVATFAVVVGLALVIGPGLSAPGARVRRPNAESAFAPTSGPRSPRTCTTRCCRRSRSCSDGPTIRARSCGWRACRNASCAAGCSAATPPPTNADASLGAALEELAADVETEHGVPVEVVRVRDCRHRRHGAAAARGPGGDPERGPALGRVRGVGVPRGRGRQRHDLRARSRPRLRSRRGPRRSRRDHATRSSAAWRGPAARRRCARAPGEGTEVELRAARAVETEVERDRREPRRGVPRRRSSAVPLGRARRARRRRSTSSARRPRSTPRSR